MCNFVLDICPGLWYYTIRKREGKPNKPERKIKMVYNYYEVHEQEWEAWQEYVDWLNFEADMATNPYDE